MSRTSTALVEGILRNSATIEGGDYDGVTGLQPFIDTANSITNKVSACAIIKGTPHTSSDLELIERWLAAWAYMMSDRGYTSRSTSGASGSFSGQTGMGFESNWYGQTALRLDNTGCLKAIDKSMTAGVTHVGKVPSERIPYENRD